MSREPVTPETICDVAYAIGITMAMAHTEANLDFDEAPVDVVCYLNMAGATYEQVREAYRDGYRSAR